LKLSVSTSWAGGDTSVEDMMARAAAVGFTRIELGVLPREKDIDSILRVCRANEWTISSLHNPVLNAHLPKDLMRGDAISSTDGSLRRQAVDDLRESIRIAEEAGAPVVVIHAGSVDLPGDWRKRYGRLEKAVKKGDHATLDAMMKERLEAAPNNLNALARSLEEILGEDSQVKVGIESRWHYEEIPVVDELDWIFRRFDSPRLVYWHDVGHCQVGELRRADPHRLWLERFAHRLAGVHLHDIVDMTDHRPVGDGTMDFTMVRSHLGEDVIPVIEPDRDWTPEELERSARNLAAMGFGEFP